jgi:hypothetical protein
VRLVALLDEVARLRGRVRPVAAEANQAFHFRAGLPLFALLTSGN